MKPNFVTLTVHTKSSRWSRRRKAQLKRNCRNVLIAMAAVKSGKPMKSLRKYAQKLRIGFSLVQKKQ